MTRLDNAKKEHLNFKEMDKKLQSITDCTIYCQNCGHSIAMPNADRTICSHCGNWVYRTNDIEFRYKMKQAIIKEKNDKTGIYV